MPNPYTDMEKVKEVMEYRKVLDEKGIPMSLRTIAEKMNKPLKSVNRWHLIGTGKIKPRLPKIKETYPQDSVDK
jgi:hypothetical protein